MSVEAYKTKICPTCKGTGIELAGQPAPPRAVGFSEETLRELERAIRDGRLVVSFSLGGHMGEKKKEGRRLASAQKKAAERAW